MNREYADFWDQAQSFIDEAESECTTMFKAGRLSVFEADWLDPLSKVSEYSWFTDARPIARRVAATSIRNAVVKMIEYYRFAEELLEGRRSAGTADS